mgnify:CR=1 FL=1
MSLSKQPLSHHDMTYGISSPNEFPFMEPLSLTQTQLLCNTMNEVKRSLDLPFGSSLGYLPMNEIISIHLAHAWMKARFIIRYHSFSEKTAANFMAAVERLISQKIENILAKRQQYIFSYQRKNGTIPELSAASRGQIEAIMQQLTALMEIPAPQFHQSYLNLIRILRDRFLKASLNLNYLKPNDIPTASSENLQLTTPPAERLFECLMDRLIEDWNQFVQRMVPALAAYYIILRK